MDVSGDWRAFAADGIDPESTFRPATQVAAGPGIASTARRVQCDGSIRPESIGYRLGAVIGTGGQGVVHEAEQIALERVVALKIARNPLAERELVQEAAVAAGLEHPGIVVVHDAGGDFLVMQRVRGRTLAEVLREGEVRPRLAALIEILARAAEAVAYAHARGVLHRDLKPANLMVGPFGEVLVLDWGLAVRAPGTAAEAAPEVPGLDHANACGGTPCYLAPEMARGDLARLGTASDVFLLGGILYRLLAGRAPFATTTVQDSLILAAANRHEALATAAPLAPRRLAALQGATMATDPAARPTAAEVASGLRAWLRSSAQESAAAAEVERSQALAAAASADPAVAYAAHRDGAAAAERALALFPGCPGAEAALRQHLAAHARRAVAVGDLRLASDLAQRCGGEAVGDLPRLITRARTRAAGRIRRLRLATSTLAIGLCALAGISAWTGWQVTHAEDIARTARAAEAARLLAHVKSGGSEAALLDRLSAGQRAAGLDPTSAKAQRMTAEAASGLLRLALAGGAGDLAQARLDLLTVVDPGAATAWLPQVAALGAKRREVLAERARRWAELAAKSAGRAAADCDDQLRAAAVEVAAWDGDDSLGPVLDTLADPASDPLDRVLAATVLGRRREDRFAIPLIAALRDAEDPVADAAATALARHGGTQAVAALAAWLRGIADPVRARLAGARLHAARLPDSDRDLALLTGDVERWWRLLAADPPHDAAGLAAAARICRWCRLAPDDALPLLRRAREAAGSDPGILADLIETLRTTGLREEAAAVLAEGLRTVRTARVHLLWPQATQLAVDQGDEYALHPFAVACSGSGHLPHNIPWEDRRGEMQTSFLRAVRTRQWDVMALEWHVRQSSAYGDGRANATAIVIAATLRDGDAEAAARQALAALAWWPGRVEACLQAERCLTAAGHSDLARQVRAEARRIDPDHPLLALKAQP